VNPQAPQPNQQPSRRRHRVVPRTQRPVLRRGFGRFKGQLPGERVIWIRRRHPIFLLTPAWPVLLSLVAAGVISVFLGSAPGLPQLMRLLALGAALVFLVRWAIVDLGSWLFQYYILTDQRAIASTGFFRPQRRVAVLKSVVQVMVQRPTAMHIALDIGDVYVRVIGSSVDFVGVWRPRVLADSILWTQDSPGGGGGGGGAPRAQTVKTERLQKALDALAEPMPMPPAPEPGPPPFFGILQRKVPVKLMEGESIVEVIYRHWFVLVLRLLPPLGVILLGGAVSLMLRNVPNARAGNLPMLVLAVACVVGLGWAILVYLNYIDDIFVLTTHRVIDIDRLVFILSDYSDDAPLARVQDIHVEHNLIGNILGYGTIVVSTSGRRYPLTMTDIPHALRVMNRVFEQINKLKDRENVVAINKQKRENYRWMATVLNELLVSVPDVRGLPLLEAVARTQAAGLKLVIAREQPARGVAPGTVLEQEPGPGSTELPENEVRVALSGRRGVAHTP
jgi:hypothetical protein